MSLPRVAGQLPAVLTFLVKRGDLYSPYRPWAAFDSLKLRAVDDLDFPRDATERSIAAYTSDPPRGTDVESISIPTQIALERFYFHVCVPTTLVINEPGQGEGLSEPQRGISFTLPPDFDGRVVVARSEVPALIGELSIDRRDLKQPLQAAQKALRKGSFFESFFLARVARSEDAASSALSGFHELFAFSFFGAAEDALALYEEFPTRGSADPWAQLLAARYRVLLRQFNEARTILHTLSFNPELGALALCELARSFLVEREFTRAIDTATAAIERDKTYGESFLVRGIAQRGLIYDSGEADGLRDAHRDLLVVAKQGGYSAAEATFHVGTICARLRALADAENAFRQSLFQRDRLSVRDALIRVLFAQNKIDEAETELCLLERLAPEFAHNVREQTRQVVATKTEIHAVARESKSGELSELWSQSRQESLHAARALLRVWDIPVINSLADCTMLDDFINRFAPDGDFPEAGRFSTLRQAGNDTVVRVIALHIADLLVSEGGAQWGADTSDGVVVVSSRDDMKIPVEAFVSERLLLGASADNFASLESLTLDVSAAPNQSAAGWVPDWWEVAPAPRLQEFEVEATWGRAVLRDLGANLIGNLSDLEEIDRALEIAFAPGGVVQEGAPQKVLKETDRVITSIGLCVGETIARSIDVVWFNHDRPEGISILHPVLGRVFPVARVQRRAYLASAVDFSTRLGSLAFSVAVASVTEAIRLGLYKNPESVREALLKQMPSIKQFPESELSGVVDSLLIRASLK